METLKVQAALIYTIFRNVENGYCVARFVTYDKQEKEFTATGIMGELEPERIYDLYGHYEEHPRYGMQFQVERYVPMQPNDSNSLIRYFSSAAFPGIGRKLAQTIVEALGDDAIQRIRQDEEVLDQIPGISVKKRAILVKGVNQLADLDDSVVFFTQYGISPQLIAKIQAKYGEEAVELVKQNPYRMVEDIDGIGFATADKLARALAFDENHPYRMQAAVLAAVRSLCMASGNTYVSAAQLKRESQKTVPSIHTDFDHILAELAMRRSLIIEADRIYHHTQYDAERGIAELLVNFPETQLPCDVADLDGAILEMEQEFHITYEEMQRQAIATFFAKPLAIISGGPGTGKTTIVKGILHLAQRYYPQAKIVLCAPTGRAAKRMSQLSEGDAITIHSLLKWDLESNRFMKDDKDPLDADILIVDEFSMVDAWLFYSLLRACRPVHKILLIGDRDQLPSVGPGCVLQDLMESNCFPMISLQKIFRQREDSDVVTLAHEIREGRFDGLRQAHDTAFFACSAYEVTKRVKQIVANAYEKGYQNNDIQVLAPMYNGVAGIDALNHALQEMMNPPAKHKREYRSGYRLFREGDKVMQLKNQPEDEVYNGDIGTIEEIIYAQEDIDNQNRIIVRYDDIVVEYAQEQIYHITHAYCISIHKAQGSEYPIVIMPVVNEYRHMLQRRLLYTGVSRAKKSLVLLGDLSAIRKAVSAQATQSRLSTLQNRLHQTFCEDEV